MACGCLSWRSRSGTTDLRRMTRERPDTTTATGTATATASQRGRIGWLVQRGPDERQKKDQQPAAPRQSDHEHRPIDPLARYEEQRQQQGNDDEPRLADTMRGEPVAVVHHLARARRD